MPLLTIVQTTASLERVRLSENYGQELVFKKKLGLVLIILASLSNQKPIASCIYIYNCNTSSFFVLAKVSFSSLHSRLY